MQVHLRPGHLERDLGDFSRSHGSLPFKYPVKQPRPDVFTDDASGSLNSSTGSAGLDGSPPRSRRSSASASASGGALHEHLRYDVFSATVPLPAGKGECFYRSDARSDGDCTQSIAITHSGGITECSTIEEYLAARPEVKSDLPELARAVLHFLNSLSSYHVYESAPHYKMKDNIFTFYVCCSIERKSLRVCTVDFSDPTEVKVSYKKP